MADRIVIMKDGRIQQVATPAQAYHHPANTFVAGFIGAPAMNMLPAVAHAGEARLWNGAVARIGTRLPEPLDDGRELIIGVRPEDLMPVPAEQALFDSRITLVEPLGAETLLYVDVAGREIIASGPGRDAPEPGDQVALGAAPDTLHVFDATSGTSLLTPPER